MFRRLPQTMRRITRRLLRPAVAFLLVLAQVVTAFGYPVLSSRAHVKACGCPVAGPDVACCCEANTCCATVAEPAPEPEPEACPKCRAKQAAKHSIEKPAPKIVWHVAMKARQCHGEGPLGLFADIPALPPVVPSNAIVPAICEGINSADHFSTSFALIPLDPPPRCG